MNPRNLRALSSPCLALLLPAVLSAQSSAPSSAAATAKLLEEILELSPFTVTTSQDVGWVATGTLLSNRTNTLIKDTPVTIEALTEEFMRDMGVYNEFEAAQWVANVQLADETARSDFGRYSFRGIQNQWTSNRNFFRWYVPNDGYNVERIDYGRGSNSLLFGDNEPGGQATVYTKRARIGTTFSQLLGQGGSFDSYRWQLDHNHTLGGKLALRLNATQNRDGRNFDFNHFDFHGYHGTLTWRPGKNTEVRFEGEVGGHERIWGDNNNSIRRTPAAGLGFNNRLTLLRSGTLIDNVATGTANGTLVNGTAYLRTRDITDAGAGAITLSDREVRPIGAFSFRGFPEHYNWAGPDNPNDRHYTTFSVFIEQRLSSKLVAELACNQQKQWWDNVNWADPCTAKVDFTGRRYIDLAWNTARQQNIVRVPRLTIAYTFDHLKWMQQTFVGSCEYRLDEFMSVQRQQRWMNAPGSTAATNVAGAAFRPFFRVYVDDPDAYPLRLERLPAVPAGTRLFNTAIGGQVHQARAYALSASGRYFGGRLQSLLGTRYDQNDTASVANFVALAANQVQGERFWPGSKWDHPTAWAYDPTFHLRRWTYNAGLVYKINKAVNVYAMDSSSFRFAGAFNFVNDPLGPIIGRTKEYGLKASFLDEKLQWNLTNYDLVRRNVRITFDRGGLTDAQLEAAVNAGLAPGSAGYRPVIAGSNADVGDNFSRGWETSFLFSPTRGVHVRLGGAHGNVIQQNAFHAIHNLLDDADARRPTDPVVLGHIATLKNSLAASGVNGQKVTGATAVRNSLNYAFDYRFAGDSKLKALRFGVNGACNDNFILGYVGPFPNSQTIVGGRGFTLHGSTSYQQKLFNRSFDLRLNVFNLVAPEYREVGLVALGGTSFSKRIFYGPPLSYRVTLSTQL